MSQVMSQVPAQASAAGAFAMGKSHDYAARARISRSLNETTRESYKFCTRSA
jgi:hypothetical protein